MEERHPSHQRDPRRCLEGIHYADAVFEEDTGEWISDAEVAEVPFTAFTSHPKKEAK